MTKDNLRHDILAAVGYLEEVYNEYMASSEDYDILEDIGDYLTSIQEIREYDKVISYRLYFEVNYDSFYIQTGQVPRLGIIYDRWVFEIECRVLAGFSNLIDEMLF